MKQHSYDKVLVPFDGSKLAESILPELLAIVSAFNSQIVLVQVIESLFQINAKISSTPFISAAYGSIDLAEQMLKQEKKSAQQHLNSLTKKLSSYGITGVQQIIREGNAPEEITKLAEETKCNLIMMSTHGRSGLGRLLIGSVTDQVLHQAKCPVLIIRPKKN